MADLILTAQLRSATGKGAARSLRRQQMVPAVCYGPGLEPLPLAVRAADVSRITRTGAGENVLLELIIDKGGEQERHRVMIKELQTDPIRRVPLHLDLYAVSMDREVTVDVPVKIVGEAPGVEVGGILEQVRRTLEVSCLPDRIPEFIEADVSGLEIGDSLHIAEIKPPEGVELREDGHLTVVTVAAPVREEEEVEEAAAGEEVEETAGLEPEGESTEEGT